MFKGDMVLEPVKHILVVDDDRSIRDSLAKILGKEGYNVATAENGEVALAYLQKHVVHLILTDLRMPRLDGFQLLRSVHRTHPEITLVLMTAHGSAEIALEAVKEGAHDYIEKPLKRAEVISVVGRALVRHTFTNQRYGDTPSICLDCPGELVGQSEAIRELLAQVQQTAVVTTEALIQGEEGTGRLSIARAIHCLSARRHRPFVVITGTARQPSCVETVIFSDEQADTGKAQENLLVRAEGGTVFLDDITELSCTFLEGFRQALEKHRDPQDAHKKSVRVLVGSKESLHDGDIPAYLPGHPSRYLGMSMLRVPPLRERVEDIPLLIGHFLRVCGDQYGKPIQHVSDQVLDVLFEYNWPGNVHELERVVAQAVSESRDGAIGLDVLPAYLGNLSASSEPKKAGSARSSLENLERKMLFEKLRYMNSIRQQHIGRELLPQPRTV